MTMLKIRDVSLFVKVMGHGDPLVLMHGGPGLDHTTLSSLEPLADQFTLIFYDHRANGRSTGAAESMTWENLTADADALRESLGFDQWAVLGHSFGGQVALEYALRYPDSVSQLLLLDTCGEARWYEENAPEILGKRGYSAATVEAARRFYNGDLRADEVRPIVMKFLRAYFYRLRLRDVPQALISGFRMKMRPETHVFAFGTLLKKWSVMDRLGDIELPTLVLSGRVDFLFPPEHQAILVDRLPNAQLEIIERAGHNAHAERAADVIGIVRRFIAANPRVERHVTSVA
jgi:proline iminopeptidase